MKATRYFVDQVMPRRPYLSFDLCAAALANPVARETQNDGRIRVWGAVTLPDETQQRILRVVLLDDGETLHNAFIDRGYREGEQ